MNIQYDRPYPDTLAKLELINWTTAQLNLSVTNTPVVKWLNSLGISHPKSIPYLIITSLHCKLNDKKIDQAFIDDLVSRYKTYWEIFE